MSKVINTSDLLGNFITDVITNTSNDSNLSIVEFAEEILFNGEVELFPQQRAVLKSYYNEPLTETEKLILGTWVEIDRSNWVEGRIYKNFALEGGRGSSKSTIGSIIALYEFYNLITLANPARHYNLLPNDPIAIFVIAQSLEQVKDTLFGKIKGYAQDSSFFKSMQETGKIEVLSESIKYPTKNIAIYAKHTNSPALVGYTIKCMILDEFARFENRIEDDGQVNSMGDEIWDNVGAGTNRFGRLGRKVAISSAWCENDPMERLHESARNDPETLTFRLRTWDLNKLKTVSRESCNSDYLRNRIKAELEYEGIRRKRGAGFIDANLCEESSKLVTCIDTREVELDQVSNGDTRYYVSVRIDRLEEQHLSPSYAHIDFSVRRDATALAITRPHKLSDDRYAIAVDGIIRWQPFIDNKGNQRAVYYENVEQVLITLAKARNIQLVSFDSFNSESSIQRLHSQGILTKQMSTSRNAQLNYYTLFRDLLSQGLILLPRDSIYTTQLITELSSLIIKPNGQITHDFAGKDLADSVVNAVYSCYTNMVKSIIYSSISMNVDKIPNTKLNNIRKPNKLCLGNAINKLYKGNRL